ncbi:MAG TPA: GNAT family N-acetyltransferase [Gemmatimonadaceae bacterium]|nr:GNAT family N-acetyltransferase [Gemmatimonadaceae bacterium]
MVLTIELATPEDAAVVAALRVAAADDLTARHGYGHWSSLASERGVIASMKHSQVWIARQDGEIVATLRLATKKPWAIDARYFTPRTRPIYLTDMAVHPRHQRQGVGRQTVEHACDAARDWPGDGIRLDAYDAPAGAGPFYEKCGFREVGRAEYRGTPLIYYEFLL